MNDDLCLLISIFQAGDGLRVFGDGDFIPGTLLKCALRIPHGMNSNIDTQYLMSSAKEIHALLPEHVASVGPICAIEAIFEVSTSPAVDVEEER